MSELAVFLLSLFSSGPAAIDGRVSILCDDGSPPLNETGEPNWRCRIEGCAPNSRVCWPDRTARCRDAAGRDLGCYLVTETCHSRFQCFELWFRCVGTYKCTEPGTVGCHEGSCTAPNGNPTPGSTSTGITWNDSSAAGEDFLSESEQTCSQAS